MTTDELVEILKKAKGGSVAVIADGHTYVLKNVVVCVEDNGVILNCEKVDVSKKAGDGDPKQPAPQSGGESRGPMPLYEQRGTQS